MLDFFRKLYSAAFELVKPEPKFDTYWINLLFDWQTLVAAILAGLPAGIGAYLLWRQIQIQQRELERVRRKEEASARIKLVPALASLTKFYKRCVIPVIDGSLSPVETPDHSLTDLMSSAPTLNSEVFQRIQTFIAEFQVFTSRYSSTTGNLRGGMQEILLGDLGHLHFSTNALYPYARFEADAVDPVAPTKNDIRDSIKNLISIARHPPSEDNWRLIERALDIRFPRKTSSVVPPVES
ncbi:hypothetical protein [Aurantimonas coralicida]|uniref:Uncharacterized protein n=1 Tax=Aurantimonas coralicida TaxID=182270 RepID=A0A0P0YZU7_9HYPH|nr:hypothetical protein [Aurantimonas coralicida]BAT26879.1 hypothetical protein [Aurantimonas coralicida]